MEEVNPPSIEIPENIKGILAKFASWLVSQWTGRLRIKEIRSEGDKDIEDSLELFERLFKEDDRVASSDLVAFLRPPEKNEGRKDSLQHCFIIAKHGRKVAALLKAIYCPISRYVLVCYFGIDKSDLITRRIASPLMLRFFRKYIQKRWNDCEGILYEAESPDGRARKKDNDERKARLRLFRELSKRLGFHAYAIDMKYAQPHMADVKDFSAEHRKLTLIAMPPRRLKEEVLPKAACEKILWFLILRIYATTQVMTQQRRKTYLEYLNKLHSEMTAQLTDVVELNDRPELWR